MADDQTLRTQELLRQQTTLARFGEVALKSNDLDEILAEACRLVGEVLGTELAKVMELCRDGQELLVRAGVGWHPGIVGEAKLKTGRFSAAGHALMTGEPIISPDLGSEDRFELPEFLKEHGVRAMVNVIILGADGKPPYGVLEVDSRKPQPFGNDDTAFLRGYANLLASAVHRFEMVSELRTKADEKERLLRELQHRVKNNLQVITSLVQIQVRRTKHPEAERELRAIGDRIETLRLVHDRLHATGEADRLDLGTYLGELAATLLRFHRGDAPNIRLIADVGVVAVSPEVAVPIGIVVTEFMTNSLKYAFCESGGTIGIRLGEVAPGQARLLLWDDGKGIREKRVNGTGLQLIAGFARQLDADVAWETDRGTKLSLTLSLQGDLTSEAKSE
jgi:two-component sensor histidine kinase